MQLSPQELNELMQDFDVIIGKGAYGSVRTLKSNPDEVVKEISTVNLSAKARAALETELDLLPRVRHQYIVDYKQILKTEKFTYIRMRKYAKSLSEVIIPMQRKNQKPSLEMILRLTAQMCEALAYLHSPFKLQALSEEKIPSIVHRDIKPANILTDDDYSNFYLADFGMCRTVTNTVCATTYAGSPAYMAPEVTFHEHYDGKADMWSLGVVIYEMAYGRVPDFLHGMPPKSVYTNSWRPDLTRIEYPELHDVIKAMLVVDPQKRSSAADVLRIPCVTEYVSNQKEAGRVNEDMNQLIEFHIRDAIKDRESHIDSLQAEISQLKTQIDSLTKKLDEQTIQQATVQADLEAKTKLLEEMYLSVSVTQQAATATNSTASVSEQVRALDNALLMRDKYIKTLIDTNKKLTARLANDDAPTYSLSLIKTSTSLVSSTTKWEDCVSGASPDMGESLMSLVQQLIVASDKGLIRRLAQSVLAHIDEAGNGSTLQLLLTGKRDGTYVLSSQRGALIRILAEREGDQLMSSGYSKAYIDCLRGKAAVEPMVQPDGWNGWFRQAEQGCVLGLNEALYMSRSRFSGPVCYGDAEEKSLTALMIAAILDHSSAVALLMGTESGLVTEENRTALMCAAYMGNTGSCCLLAAAETKRRDSKKRTAMHYAAEAGHPDVVQVLLPREGGLVDIEGTTALMLAAKSGYIRIVSILMKKEGRRANKTGATALMYSCKWGHIEIARLLANIECRKMNKLGLTSLMVAAQYGQMEIAEALLPFEDGLVTKTGMTALMCAAQAGQREVVKALIPKQACRIDKHRITALMYAAAKGHHEVVALLATEEAGMMDINGISALVYAAYRGHFKCVEILAPLEAAQFGERAITEMASSRYQTMMPVLKNKIEEYMHK